MTRIIRREGVAVSETTMNVMITKKFTNIRSKVNERNTYNFYYIFSSISNVIAITVRICDCRYDIL